MLTWRLCLVLQVLGVSSALPVVVERVADLEGRLGRSLAAARRGLDILADQLVALGALNGRSSPNKNPLAGGSVQAAVAGCWHFTCQHS